MDNLVFTAHHTLPLQYGQPLKTCYEHASKTIVIVNTQCQLYFIEYSPEKRDAFVRNSTAAIQ